MFSPAEVTLPIASRNPSFGRHRIPSIFFIVAFTRIPTFDGTHSSTLKPKQLSFNQLCQFYVLPAARPFLGNIKSKGMHRNGVGRKKAGINCKL